MNAAVLSRVLPTAQLAAVHVGIVGTNDLANLFSRLQAAIIRFVPAR
jgi:hypothetical protein